MLEQLALVGAAISCTTRLAIVEVVAQNQGCIMTDVAYALDVTPATISRHVAILVAAGLLERRRSGRCTVLRVRVDRLRVVRDACLACRTSGLAREIVPGMA
jgi:DNA-binding transcriptional ArsR family regulator